MKVLLNKEIKILRKIIGLKKKDATSRKERYEDVRIKLKKISATIFKRRFTGTSQE